MSTDQLIESFQAKYQSLAGVVYVLQNTDELMKTLLALFEEKSANRIVLADLEASMENQIEELCVKSGIDVLKRPFPRDILPNAIDEAQIGITEVEFGIAETGTIVEFAVNDDSRLVSTLTDTHVAILRSSRIIAWLKDAAPRIQSHLDSNQRGVSVSFISGPSRSGDIEMKLTLGVHGPRESYVIVMDERND